MKNPSLSRLVIFILASGLTPAFAWAQAATNQTSWFQPNPEWAAAETVKLSSDGSSLEATTGSNSPIIYYTGKKPDSAQLKTQAYYGDAIVKMEFLVPAGSQAGIYLEGRYRVELSAENLGKLGAQEEAVTADANQDGIPALVNAGGAAGTWQTLEAQLRVPRFDDARNKLEDALLIEVKINGKVVQSNTVARGWSRGADFRWHDYGGHTTLKVDKGSLAIRNFSIHRAEFNAVKVPEVSGQPTNVAKLIDFVKLGENTFRGLGCIECHAVQRDDNSVKTGPNVFGLFTLEPRDRTVAANEGHRFTIKADRAYLVRSLRTPLEELAIAETGPTKGQPYLPVMPPFVPALLSDYQIDAIGSYLATLNEGNKQGPVVRLVTEAGIENYDPMTDRLQVLVDQTVRIQRGPMQQLSGRAIHVGLPNGINYSFDPRVLAVAKVWQGGFLDMTGEWLARGGNGIKMGFESREIDLGAAATLLAPLNAKGQPVDFSFKDPKFQDEAAVRASLYNSRDHLDLLKDADAQFLGYSRDSTDPKAAPVFNYRVGPNTVSLQTIFEANGQVRMVLDGDFATAQSFVLNEKVLGKIKVSAGKLRDGQWELPAGKHQGVTVQGRLAVAQKAWHSTPSKFNYQRQPLVIEPSTPTIPRGYRAETYLAPKDNYGRDLLFEALGLAVAPDGTIVVATRTAGIWRLVKGEWQLFAEGLFDSLGVVIEDQHGLSVVAGQKAEVSRISDTNGDGVADSYVTMTDAFGYNGNYHSYVHGPVRDANGDYFITLNLADASQSEAMYKAGGKYMGTSGGYRGWAIRVPAKGGFEPWADGLRSPAGLGVAPDGRIWYADNQGEFFGTSKLFVLKKGAFYGHPSGLVDRPGLTPDSPELAWTKVMDQREKEVVLFPQSRLANSPGNPAWDTTGGRFGPYGAQMFIGDQTQSDLMRVITEKVGDQEQGVAIPFAADLESGVMRPVFLPDGSMLLGQTGRGWQAKGGRVASLQRIVWDGKTIAPAIERVSVFSGGFEIRFTTAIPEKLTDAEVAAALSIKSWTYRDAPDYGSPELDEHAEPVTKVTVGSERTTLRVTLAKTEQPEVHPQQIGRVYQLSVAGKTIWGETNPSFEAFYTVHQFPAATSAHQ